MTPHVLESASDYWSIMLIAFATVITGGAAIFWSLGDNDDNFAVEGLGIVIGGVAMAISTWGVHTTLRSNPLDWAWIGVLFTGAVVMYACCYQPQLVRRAVAAPCRR